MPARERPAWLTFNVVTAVRRLSASPLVGFAVAYTASAALQKAVGFAVFLWLAHSLSVRDYARFGLLYALQTALTTFACAGIVESVIGLLRDHNAASARARLFGAANTVFAVLAAASIAVSAMIYYTLMQDTERSAYDFLFVVVAGTLAAYVVVQGTLVRLEERHLAAVAMGFLAPLGAFLGGAVGFIQGGTVTAFYAGMALGSVVMLVPFALSGVGFYRCVTERRAVTGIMSLLAPFILIAVLAWVSGYGNTYLVKTFFTATDVARFTFAYTLASVMQLVATSLNQVWSPRFFRLVHEMPIADLERRNKSFTTLQGAALGVVGGALLIVLPPALQFAGGNLATYSQLNREFFFLFAAYAVSVPWWHAQNYYYAHNKGSELMRVSVASALAGLLLWLTSIWVLGVIGVYVGFMLQMLTRTVGAVGWARKLWAINIAWEGVFLALSLLALGAAISAVTFV